MSQKVPFQIVVFLSGRGSNFHALLKYIEERALPIQTVLVVSDQADAEGLSFARARNIPVKIVPRRVKEITKEQFNTLLAEAVVPHKPDLIVLAGFMRVLTREFISPFRGKIINIHPSLLPDFRGLHAQAQALAAGVSRAGCTVHLVEEEVDGGPIIVQASVPVLPEDTEDSLSARILEKEHLVLPATVAAFAAKRLRVTLKDGRQHLEVLSSIDFPEGADIRVFGIN